jgi:hypothetical protein
MPNFNATLRQARNDAIEQARKDQLADAERARKQQAWVAEQASRLAELRARTEPKLQILQQLKHWLHQDKRLRQLGKRTADFRRVFSIGRNSIGDFTYFGFNAEGQWVCQGHSIYSEEGSDEFLYRLDLIGYNQIARGIEQLARTHGWELPDIDMDIPDDDTPDATSLPKTKPIEQHPKWRRIFRNRP